MASTHPDIPVLDLAGTPGQLGAAHGEAQRERIRAYAERFVGWLLAASPLRLTEAELWARWAPQAECHCVHCRTNFNTRRSEIRSPTSTINFS